MTGALLVLLERQLDASVPPEREIMQQAQQAFVVALRDGFPVEAAFDQARAASRFRAREVAARVMV